MPEWNLVEAQATPEAQASSKFALSKIISAYSPYFLVFAVLVLTMQVGCAKVRGGLDRNILRSSQTVPELEASPIPAKVQFNNDPSEALRELNEANGVFEGSATDAATPESMGGKEMYAQGAGSVSADALPLAPAPVAQSTARVAEVSRQLFEAQEAEVKQVAIQPPAPSLKNSFVADQFQPTTSVKKFANLSEIKTASRVLLGGAPLSEIEPVNSVEPVNPAKATVKKDYIELKTKEALNAALALAQPIQSTERRQIAPPSALVSQPLAPILFDETTRQVEALDTEQTKQNNLRVLGSSLSDYSTIAKAPVEEQVFGEQVVEGQVVAEPIRLSKTQSSRDPSYPTVDPNLGRTAKLLSTCSKCKSYQCSGDCKAGNQHSDDNQLRSDVPSERLPAPAQSLVKIEDSPQVPIEIKGQFLPNTETEVQLAEEVDDPEFTTEELAQIIGPAKLPTLPQVESENLRSDFNRMIEAEVPSQRPLPLEAVQFADDSNQFRALDHNDFSPAQTESGHGTVELVAATTEVPAEPASWIPPENSNFSPIPNSVRERSNQAPLPAMALENAAKQASVAALPLVEAPALDPPVADVDIEVPLPQPEVIVEVVDNTVPWSVKLAETIDNVRRQRDSETDPMARNGIEVNLRLLEVLERQMITVEESRNLMPNNEAHYWQHQLDAIALMLPAAEGVSDLDRHNTAHQTLEHLRKAVQRLESLAALKVTAGKFCTEINGFGKYKPFASSVFQPGQKTLVYCEVENYTSNSHVVNAESSYHTRLRGSYVIYDSQGRVVQQSEYPAVEDVARNRRRDFYMYFPIQVGELAAGDYKLDLLVEDLSSNKTAALKPGLTFQVR